MNNAEKQFHDFIISMIGNDNIVEEKDIDDSISQLKTLPMFFSLSDSQISKIKAQITSERNIQLEKGTLIVEDGKHEKWFLSRKSELSMAYWDRYKKYLMQDKGFPINVVNTMDDILDTLTDLLGDPQKETYSRKGLVIGDVQSGKTANYTGLICKAADAKYEIIVLLTGTIESLRRQTQIRLDEGFVGWDSVAMENKNRDLGRGKPSNSTDGMVLVGAGKYNSSIHPVSLTTTINDFKAASARSVVLTLKSLNEPLLFVVKKNVSVLKRLNKWLRTFNQNGNSKIDTSILVIDDEADNASVNTNPEDKDPTAINNQITDLIDVFTKSSYVGFTATPYANIFIDPDTNEAMEKEDLFPKDYIYALNAPDNYIGARDIFNENGKYKNMCIQFTEEQEEELEEIIPLRHKNGFYISRLPKSMIEAIATFMVANAIRDMRGDTKEHRSMLINVSRFNSVQQQVYNYVNSFVKDIKSSVKVNGKLSVEDARRDKNIKLLEDTYYKYYSELEFSWEDILLNLKKAIEPIELVIVNQNNQKGLDYQSYPNGMRVIAIGGLSLSRGLTLEGLMASYFYRNSRMYDTLMQMGRWFGYRKNYDDLCKIWMSSTSYEWYSHISEATDELKHDIERYQDSGLTPLDFGLRVRSDINTLLVTARNKMRTADTTICTISLSEECIETTDLFVSDREIELNELAVRRLIDSIKQNKTDVKTHGNTIIFKNVQKDLIIDLLDEIEIPVINEKFDTEVLIDFIQNYRGNELKLWDVVFASGSNHEEYTVFDDYSVPFKERSFSLVNDRNIVRMSGSKRRLGNSNDGIYGLENISSKEIKSRVIADKYEKRSTLRQNDYFRYDYIRQNRNPQIIIYNVILNKAAKYVNKNKDGANISDLFGKKVIGFGIGIPKLKDEKTKYAKYTINKIAQSLSSDYDIGDEE